MFLLYKDIKQFGLKSVKRVVKTHGGSFFFRTVNFPLS